MTRQTPWQRLAQQITTRRTQLGLTQSDIAARGGPSVATMRLLEGALQDNYRGNTLGRVDRALEWRPGSAAAVLDGGDPTPQDAPAPPAPPCPDIEAELRQIADNPDRSEHLRDWARAQLQQLAGIRAANAAEARARNERRSS